VVGDGDAGGSCESDPDVVIELSPRQAFSDSTGQAGGDSAGGRGGQWHRRQTSVARGAAKITNATVPAQLFWRFHGSRPLSRAVPPMVAMPSPKASTASTVMPSSPCSGNIHSVPSTQRAYPSTASPPRYSDGLSTAWIRTNTISDTVTATPSEIHRKASERGSV